MYNNVNNNYKLINYNIRTDFTFMTFLRHNICIYVLYSLIFPLQLIKRNTE